MFLVNSFLFQFTARVVSYFLEVELFQSDDRNAN